MDKKILVDRDIEDGKRLIEELDKSKFQLNGALWFYFKDSEEWRLLFVSPLVDTVGPRTCYRIVQSAIADLSVVFRISLEHISVLSPRGRLIQLLKIAIRTDSGLSTIRFTGNTINGVFIEDALIYRLV
jgi:hypothetical protein